MMLKKQMHHDVIIANRGKADSTFQVCCCIPIQGRHQGEKSLSFLNLQLSLPSSFKFFAENLYRISAVAPARHCHEVSLVRVCCEGCRQWQQGTEFKPGHHSCILLQQEDKGNTTFAHNTPNHIYLIGAGVRNHSPRPYPCG